MERLTPEQKIAYLTMLDETVPQATMQAFLEQAIPQASLLIEQTIQNFIKQYLATANKV
jgi:hypothetical protein